MNYKIAPSPHPKNPTIFSLFPFYCLSLSLTAKTSQPVQKLNLSLSLSSLKTWRRQPRGSLKRKASIRSVPYSNTKSLLPPISLRFGSSSSTSLTSPISTTTSSSFSPALRCALLISEVLKGFRWFGGFGDRGLGRVLLEWWARLIFEVFGSVWLVVRLWSGYSSAFIHWFRVSMWWSLDWLLSSGLNTVLLLYFFIIENYNASKNIVFEL